MAGRSYVRNAWVIFFILGFLGAFASLGQLLGMSPDPPSAEVTTGLTTAQIAARVPGILNYVTSIDRQLGNFMLGFGVLTMGIAAVPFRRGERWAWYVLWIWPVVLVIQTVNGFISTPGGGLGWQLDFSFIFILSATLLISLRKFFPKKAIS